MIEWVATTEGNLGLELGFEAGHASPSSREEAMEVIMEADEFREVLINNGQHELLHGF